jgi:hypothetical protein
MNMMRAGLLGLVASAIFAGTSALAAVTADEAKQLGGETLTPFGAERAGNKEGTIPAYSGVAPKAPASYDLAHPGQRPDPFGDKPLFTITAQNAAQYADKLDGMMEVFKKYPNFKMEIYPSHRDFAYPKNVIDGTLKNATLCKATDASELVLDGCYAGYPFPIPKTGNEVMWNHMLQFQSVAVDGRSQQWLVPVDQAPFLETEADLVEQYDYHRGDKPNPAAGTAYRKFYMSMTGPASHMGEKYIALAMLDMLKGDKVYAYLPGQRRVKLAPNIAYDAPSPFTGGASTIDEGLGYYGAMDRYDFKLVGKKEKFIPYDDFQMTDARTCSVEKILSTKNFANPDCLRWELHRVWVVDATLKPGFRHIYAKRKFYWDEDFQIGGLAEEFDAGGKLFRLVLQYSYPYYAGDGGGGVAEGSIFMDLNSGRWATQGMTACPACGFTKIQPKESRFFSPDVMAGEGVN